MKEFGLEKVIFDKLTAVKTCCIDGALVGQSNQTTAFNGAIWYFVYTI